MKTILPRVAFLLMAGTALANATETTKITDLTFSNVQTSGTATVNSSDTKISAQFAIAGGGSLLNLSDKIAVGGQKNLQTTGNAGETVWTLNFTLTSTEAVTVNQVVLSIFSCTGSAGSQNVNRNGTFDCSLGDVGGNLDKTNLTYTTSTAQGQGQGTPAFDANTKDKTDGENIVGIQSSSLGTEANRLSLVFNFDKPVTIGSGTEGVVLAVKGIHPSITQGGTFAGVAKITLNSAPVPEPSMFGVLAGLGALALVGARRRRKNGK